MLEEPHLRPQASQTHIDRAAQRRVLPPTGKLSSILIAPSIHASGKRSSRAKSFFTMVMQPVLTRTKVVVEWHQPGILAEIEQC
jgi:hypothetical protein